MKRVTFIFALTVFWMIGLLGAFRPVESAEATASTTLIARWPLDEGRGSTINDSENNYDGTISGAAWSQSWPLETGHESSLSFDGDNDYIDTAVFDIDNDFTVSAWVYVNDFSRSGNIVGKHTSGGGNQFLLGIYSGGYHVRIRSVTFTNVDTVKGWQHLVVTGEETLHGTYVRLYRDGTLLHETELSEKIGDVGNGKKWTIGQDWDGSVRTDYFAGNISEVRIYNGALDSSQISVMHNFRSVRVQNDDFWSNAGATGCITPLGFAHNVAFGASFTAPPPADFGFDATAYALNLALKGCAPVVVPERNHVYINPPSCEVTLNQEAMGGDYSNVLGIPLPFNDAIMPGTDWGALGTPEVFHINTDVRLSASYPGVFDEANGTVTFGNGINQIRWRGDTMVHPLDFIPIYWPGPNPDRKSLQAALDVSLELASIVGSAVINSPIEPYGIYNDELQYVVVTDLVKPTIRVAPSMEDVSVEAIEVGGVSRIRFEHILRDSLTFSDNCDDDPFVFPQGMPVFADVGEVYTITWTVQDDGPRTISGGRNEASVTQILRVVDTKPPIMLAPPSIVRETTALPATIEMGHPGVFDLADLNPTVTHNACAQSGVVCEPDGTTKFPAGQTTVTWAATDGSGNSASVTQLVNIKALGSNNAPSADSQNTNARSFEPITLTLTANDPDADPLWFSTVTPPAEGFFKAPLLPYFIHDYRIEASGVDLVEYCDQNPTARPYTNYPVDAEFMAVDDDDNVYIFDYGHVNCGHDGVSQQHRIAKLFPDGSYIESNRQFEGTVNDLYIDFLRNHIVVADKGSNHGNPWVYRLDLDTLELVAQYRVDYADYPNGTDQGNDLDSAEYAVVDEQGIMYLAGDSDLWLFDTAGEPSQWNPIDFPMVALTKYYSDGVEDAGDYNSFDNGISGLAIDLDRNLYVSSGNNVYKFGPATLDSAGNFTPGNFIGWLGACVDGADCDVANERSFGFRCTDATCTRTSYSTNYNSGPGQFRNPRGMAVGPNDILYVTDSSNDRVQRFTQDGYFAGQAQSECGGSCFTLGDFGSPKHVTVNSNHFYVLDESSDLLHIFETTPIRPKTNSTAEVVYQSNNNFVGTDSFQYDVTDGLATSSAATVTIDVTRNQRPPRADRYDEPVMAVEDTPIAIPLTGYDPDEAFDTLTFNVVRQPTNGTFADGTYTPNADFAGIDTFEFVVDDGTLQSEPRTVTVTVSAENDPPRFPQDSSRSLAYRAAAGATFNPTRMTLLGQGANDTITVGRGFVAAFTVEYTDPDDALHAMYIDWGDGTLEHEGQALEDGTTTGPLLIQSQPDGSGLVTANHIYESTGTYVMRVCLTDQIEAVEGIKIPTAYSVQACKAITVSVVDMVDVSADLNAAQNPLPPSAPLHYTVRVRNSAPAQGVGLTASTLIVTTTLPAETTYVLATPSQGSCSHNSGTVVCHLLGLSSGNTATINMIATVDQHVVGESLEATTIVSTSSENQADMSFDYEDVVMVDSADYIVNTIVDTEDADPNDGLCADADGNCSLRAALTQAIQHSAQRSSLVTVALGSGTFELDVSLGLRNQIELIGLGATKTRITFTDESASLLAIGTFPIDPSKQVTIKGVAIDGRIENLYTNLTLEDVTISNGRAAHSGGGLYTVELSTTTIRNSSITGNHAATGGGIYNEGSLVLENVTVSGNSADTHGGMVNTGFAQLRHVTISHNSAEAGTGGLHPEGNTSVQHTLIAQNRLAGELNDCSGAFVSLGYNLIETSCSAIADASDIVNVDPRLLTLNLNDAETLTVALDEGSPALDAGNSTFGFDQRGVARDAAADIGAYERTIGVPTAVVVSTASAEAPPTLAAGMLTSTASLLLLWRRIR